MKFLVLLCLFSAGAYGQLVSSGGCPKTEGVKDFDPKEYSGVWNEIYRYETKFEKDMECVTLNYTLENKGFRLVERGIVGSKAIIFNGDVLVYEEAKLVATSGNSSSSYYVLATDYTDFSLLYSCSSLPDNKRSVNSWILSRQKHLSPQAVLKVNSIIEKNNSLSWNDFRYTNHTETACKFTREIDISS